MTPLKSILAKYHTTSQSEREKATYFRYEAIVNDANLWATETMNNAKYPLELFLRVITVSLETMRVVNALPLLNERTTP